jgi:hypothetical protein
VYFLNDESFLPPIFYTKKIHPTLAPKLFLINKKASPKKDQNNGSQDLARIGTRLALRAIAHRMSQSHLRPSLWV